MEDLGRKTFVTGSLIGQIENTRKLPTTTARPSTGNSATSFSAGGECVEIAELPDVVGVRAQGPRRASARPRSAPSSKPQHTANSPPDHCQTHIGAA